MTDDQVIAKTRRHITRRHRQDGAAQKRGAVFRQLVWARVADKDGIAGARYAPTS